MWTEITRPQYERSGLRYASDLTDKEWKVIAPHLPARKRHGRPRTTDLREVLNAILYMARTGFQWRMLPREFPPRSTVQRYFYAWRSDGTLRTLNHHLLMAAREAAGREASPSAGVIDSQSVKTTEAGVSGASMRPSWSRGASAISSPIPVDCWSAPWSTPPTSRIAMVRRHCWPRSDMPSLGFAMSSPMVATPGRSSPERWPNSAPGRWRSSDARMRPRVSFCCPGDGWWRGPSLGSAATDASPRTSKKPSKAPRPG